MTELLRVFLCHASQDKQVVRNLCNKLLADSFDVWLDENKLLPGQEWEIEIPKAVRNSHIVVICISQKSIGKEGYVQKEIRVALDVADEKPEGTIFLIPARLDDCTVPDRLRKWQWVDLFESNGYQRLQNSLNLRMASLGLNKLPPLVEVDATIAFLELNKSLSLAGNDSPIPVANWPRRETAHKEISDFVINTYKDQIRRGVSLDDVINQLQSAIKLYPRQVALWQTLGDAYMRSNRSHDAFDAYTKAEKILRR